MDKILDINICGWDTSNFLIISGNVFDNFVYYSHLLPSITILALAFVLFLQNPKHLPNRALLLIAVVFSCWSYIDLILWATEKTDVTMFFWSILIYFDLSLYVAAFYFVYTFINKKMPSWKTDFSFLLAYLPLFIFAHTKLNLIAYDFTNCDREALEGPLWQGYVYPIEIIIVLSIIILSIQSFLKARSEGKKSYEILLLMLGTVIFLTMFSIGNIAGSLEINWEIGQYGLFGMPILAIFLSYLVVKYQAFKTKVLATEILLAGIGILILSLLFISNIHTVQIIAFITLLMFSILGTLLVRSVRKEVAQREQIQSLAVNLEKANVRLQALDKQKSEFVSIASHQLRSPLTAIKGYSAMFLEGSYGELGPKMKEPLERMFESAKLMAMSIEDFLNVSRIESGNMKYEYSDFNLAEQARHIVDDLKPEALKVGLALSYKTDISSQGFVHADIGKTQQILHNLINNSLKYTQQGSITVYVHEHIQNKKLYVEIIDTGIGMSKETIEDLFAKFSRAKNANSVNIKGTGLGLFVAREMARAMNGDITAHSAGDGQGSQFILTLPLVK